MAGIVLGGVVVWLCSRGSDSGQVTFQRLDPLSFQRGMQAGKPIVIYVAGTSDAASEEQNRGALRDARVIAALEPFARFKILASASNPMAELLRAQMRNSAMPVFVFMTPQGEEVAELAGVQSADAILAAAAKASKATSEHDDRASMDAAALTERSIAAQQAVESGRELEEPRATHSRRTRRDR
jgi:hypothetical protein